MHIVVRESTEVDLLNLELLDIQNEEVEETSETNSAQVRYL